MAFVIGGTGGGGSNTFTELGDTPNDYTGKVGLVPTVNPAEDGLTFQPTAYVFESVGDNTQLPAGHHTDIFIISPPAELRGRRVHAEVYCNMSSMTSGTDQALWFRIQSGSINNAWYDCIRGIGIQSSNRGTSTTNTEFTVPNSGNVVIQCRPDTNTMRIRRNSLAGDSRVVITVIPA